MDENETYESKFMLNILLAAKVSCELCSFLTAIATFIKSYEVIIAAIVTAFGVVIAAKIALNRYENIKHANRMEHDYGFKIIQELSHSGVKLFRGVGILFVTVVTVTVREGESDMESCKREGNIENRLKPHNDAIEALAEFRDTVDCNAPFIDDDLMKLAEEIIKMANKQILDYRLLYLYESSPPPKEFYKIFSEGMKVTESLPALRNRFNMQLRKSLDTLKKRYK